jgi:hypothetical protein
VLAQAAAVVLERRALALHDVLQVVEVGVARLGDRAPLGAGHDDLGGDAAAQFRLGLRAREPAGCAGGGALDRCGA